MAMIPTIRDDVAVSIATIGHSCLVYPDPVEGKSSSFELKQNLLMRLPVFHDLPIEEPNQHLSRFVTIVECMRLDIADPQILKMKAFPFSLDGAALDWYEDLHMWFINSWEKLVQEFLQKFYPATRVMSMRSQIAGIQQYATETYVEYYARFQKLQKRCPQHGFTKGSLLHFFYQGLNETEKRLLDYSARGAFIDLTHDAAEQLITKRAANELQYGSRANVESILRVESNQRLTNIEQHIERLSALIQNGSIPRSQVCGTCTTPAHSTDSCPTFGYRIQGANHFLDSYNPRWGDHSRYDNNNGAMHEFQFQDTSTPYFQQREEVHQNSANRSTIKKLLARLAEGQLEMQKQCAKDSQDIKEVQIQLGDVVTNINQKHEFVEILETTQPQPKFEHLKVITTCNSLGEKSSISQANDVLDELKEEVKNLQHDDEKVFATTFKEKSPNLSYLIGFNCRFDYIPFPSRLMHTKVNEMEGKDYVDTEILSESTIGSDVQEKCLDVEDDVFSQVDDIVLQEVLFVAAEENLMVPPRSTEKPASPFILEFDIDSTLERIPNVVKESKFHSFLCDAPKLEWKHAPTHLKYHIPFSEQICDLSANFTYGVGATILWMLFILCNFYAMYPMLKIDQIALKYPP